MSRFRFGWVGLGILGFVLAIAGGGVLAQEDGENEGFSLGASLSKFRKSLLGESPERAEANRRASIRRTDREARRGEDASTNAGERTKRVNQGEKRDATENSTRDLYSSRKRAALPKPKREVEYVADASARKAPVAEPTRREEMDDAATAEVADDEEESSGPEPTLAEEAPSAKEDARKPRAIRAEATPRVARGRANSPAPPRSAPAEPLSLAGRSPSLSVETVGPSRLLLGQVAPYQIRVRNHGEIDAENVRVSIAIPASAQVRDTTPTEGTVEANTTGASATYVWKLANVPANSSRELTLEMSPTENQSLELEIELSSAPVMAKATIEVQRPELNVAISGPKEVVCGKKYRYVLTFSNPGNGPAENIVVSLAPISAGDKETTHKLGTLAAGGVRDVEVELVAREGGPLTIHVDAAAEHDLKTTAELEIASKKPELKITVAAPKSQYIGAPATFEIKVANDGAAPAQNVQIMANLPASVELIAVSSAVKSPSDSRRLTWNLAELAAGEEKSITLKLSGKTAGECQVRAEASADGDLRASSSASTKIVAVADLVLEVKDPAGPIAIGEEMTYEIHVRNRGGKAAELIEVTAYFANGVIPISAEQGDVDAKQGTVTMQPIASLAAGAETVFKIQAKADAAGNHRVRVELHSDSQDTKLTQEETTLFYDDAAEVSGDEDE